ncbi:hypothetical protein QZJ86_00665 [Methylomonas montana]|uniref:hypothetical protein n=1 Tax=Methylomonas montana TaxID=3058963 RepID=UPI002657DD52|nr:hypothetical protein [Methylomonas montana]WKJ90678.1 hypothetical protein QZJ86_00665 [Methylomonas montana]
MPQQNTSSGEFSSYVLFSQFKDDVDGKRILIFIEESEDLAKVEERKAELNREMPVPIKDTTVSVGVATFHPHPEDEEKDYMLVTPRDGTEPFFWHQMIDVKEILEFAKERNIQK